MYEQESKTTSHDRSSRQGGPLVDRPLLDDIELLADVIAEVSRFPRRLSPKDVDRILGITPDTGCDHASKTCEDVQ